MNTESTSKERLLVFAKAPRLGRVKTRLCPPLSAEQALNIHRALVEDTLERLQRWVATDVERYLYLSEPLASPTEIRVPEAWQQRIQQGEDLGARLENAFRQAFEAGVQRVVVMGSDSPTVPLQCVDEAFRELGRRDVVLGPSKDGGYYLLGASCFVPELFNQIVWGQSTVLQQTTAALQASRRSYKLLISWYDIDTDEDLARLRDEVEFMARENPDQVPNRVAAALPDDGGS